MCNNMNNVYYVDYYYKVHYFKNINYSLVINLDKNLALVKKNDKFYFYSKGFNRVLTSCDSVDLYSDYKFKALMFDSYDEAIRYYKTGLYSN